MASAAKCCVPGCLESGELAQPLHRFPNPELEKGRFNSWLYAIGGDIIGLENGFIYKYRRVCRRHFDVKFLCRSNRLSNIAVPTLNMPDPRMLQKFTFGHRRPMQEIQNIAWKPTVSSGDIIVSEDPSVTNALCSEQEVTISEAMVSTSITKATKDNLGDLAKDSSVSILSPSELAITDSTPSTSTAAAAKDKLGEIAISQKSKKTKKQLFFTDAEKKLRQQIIAAKVKICKYKNKCRRQAAEIKAAKKIASNPTVVKTIEKCSIVARLLMQIQWRENKKKAEGRRFTLHEKIAALTVMKQSPKAYRFLRKVFVLPAPQTLIILIQKSNMSPGINTNIFTQLKKKAQSMKSTEKLCILLFDEISIKTNVTYNSRRDRITGFVDNGERRLKEFANHAQVFMVRGLVYNYKQAVAYTFATGATKGIELARQIKLIVTKIQEAGLVVIASICDQGTNNRQAIKLLQNETRGIYLRRNEVPKEKIILINDKEIVPLYDPPHLLKGIRNNLLTKDLKFTQNSVVKIAKWSHLKLLFNENPAFEGIRMIPKLSENHINPEKMNKMKVKFAAQIFSRTVASNMGYLADKGILPRQCKDTASLLLVMDNLFDSFNGSYKKNGNAKPLLKAASQHSLHHKTWAETIKILKTMKFINASKKEESVPSINNWVWTLEAVEVLLKKVNAEFGINSIWMRHLNQDPLENFFGAIRSHGCRNNNPSCAQFESAFATLVINNLTNVHTHGRNCEADLCEALHALVIESSNCEATSTISFDFTNILSIDCTNCIALHEKESDPKKIAPLIYISGYFLKKIKEKIYKNCQMCNNKLLNESPHEYIQYREYVGRRWLCSPSKQFLELICNSQHITNEILKNNLESSNLKEIILTALLTHNDYDFISCKEHKKKIIDYLLDILINFYIYLYCKNINKILSGRIQIYDDEDLFQNKAKKIFYKCHKRKRK